LWCKNTTSGYDGVDIKSFKTGFRDGHAFLALVHKYDPAVFNYDDLNKLSTDQRLEKAFELAEKTINIPKLLDVNEVMKGTTDERALILYTSLFFHAFSAQAQARAAAGKHDSLQDALSSAQQSKEELLKKVADLEKANAELKANHEEELRKLREQLEAETQRANTQTKRGDDLQSRLDELTKRADAEFSLLLLLRQQFDQHVLDMHNWRKLVEVDTVSDFLMEVKTPLVEELAKAGGFDVQVSKLRSALETETKDIQKYLKDKEDFNKQKISKK